MEFCHGLKKGTQSYTIFPLWDPMLKLTRSIEVCNEQITGTQRFHVISFSLEAIRTANSTESIGHRFDKIVEIGRSPSNNQIGRNAIRQLITDYS
jgi:hypothetical protein